MKLTKGIGILTIDAFLRYYYAAKFIIPHRVLDAGAGGSSKLPYYKDYVGVVSFDLKLVSGVDVAGDIRFLPFRDKCFDTVIAIDVLEHIPEKFRDAAVTEMKRVATKRIVIHMPLQDGKLFKGHNCDLLFSRWYKQSHGRPETNTQEHLSYSYWSPSDLRARNFKLFGTYNTNVWMAHMITAHGVLYPFNIMLAWMLYTLLLRWFDKKPPYWGGIALLDIQTD